MSGNGNPTTKDNTQVPNTTITLVITLDQVTGAVNVAGPVGNLLLVYGMLEAAKDSCREFIKQQNANSRIIPAAGMPNLRM
jgi:hypothetical protein